MKATLLFLLCATSLACAGDTSTPHSDPALPATEATLFPIPKLTGSIWERERLLGDLGGSRQMLAERGVQMDFNTTQIYQGVLSGGETDEWARSVGANALGTLSDATLRSRERTVFESKFASGREALNEFFRDKISKLNLGNFGNTGQDEDDYFGSWEFNLKLDSQKMGLWPGGFLFMRAQGIYGGSVNSRSGALLPVNTNALMPEPGLDAVTIPHLYITQFLSERLAIALGKLDTSNGDANEFAHYANNETFMNLAFAFNPVSALTVPYSTLGASIIVLPTKNFIVSFAALDGEGTATRTGFDTVFEGKTTYTTEATLITNFFKLPGHQLIGGTYGNGDYANLDQQLTSFLPDANGPTHSDNTWSIYYNAQQYFWTTAEDKTRGWGAFARIGFADKQTNPIEQFYSLGFGGKGIGNSRPYDRWGIGYYYMKTSDDLPDFLQLDDEQGGEVFYNFAVTPAFFVTADLQVINSAKENTDTAVIGGLRATLRF